MNIDEAMSAAAEKLGAAESPPEIAEAPAVESPAAETETAPESAQDTRTAAERARDEKGRFAPKPGDEPARKPAVAPKGGANGAASAAPSAGQGKPAAGEPPSPVAGQPAPEAAPVKAPQSWTPAEREAFAKAPPEVQKAALRREAEITRTLNETAEARKTVEQVRSTLSPYEGIARANGMDTMQYAGSVMQTAAVLHMGSAQQKAALVAQIIGAYGIDVDAVNAAMQGQTASPSRAVPQPPQNVSQLVQQEFQRAAQAAAEAKAAQAWDEFQATAPEFLEQVKPAMREILHLAGQQGRNMTYQQAYDRACKLDEEVSAVLAQREAAKAIRTPQPVTGAARAAASSVRSSPAAAPVAQPKGIDGALARAREKLGL